MRQSFDGQTKEDGIDDTTFFNYQLYFIYNMQDLLLPTMALMVPMSNLYLYHITRYGYNDNFVNKIYTDIVYFFLKIFASTGTTDNNF